MDTFLLYMLFAVATSLTSLYELVYPVMSKEAAELSLEGKKVESVFIIYVTFLILNTLAAPLVFFSCVIPSWGDRFRATLQKALFKED